MKRNKRESKNHFKIIASIIGAIIVLIAIIVTIVVVVGKDEDVRNGNIVSFSFSRGYGMSGAIGYTIKRQGNEAVLKYDYYKNGNQEENPDKTIDAKYLDELADIIREKDVVKWDGFDESDDDVLDGSGFTLKVEYDDGKKIEAHGYMKYPSNYDEVEAALDNKLEEIRDLKE